MISNRKYGWFVVGTTIANQGLAMGILLSGFALFVIPWIDEFQVSRSQVLLGSTLVLVMNSLLSPPGGKPVRYSAFACIGTNDFLTRS